MGSSLGQGQTRGGGNEGVVRKMHKTSGCMKKKKRKWRTSGVGKRPHPPKKKEFNEKKKNPKRGPQWRRKQKILRGGKRGVF